MNQENRDTPHLTAFLYPQCACMHANPHTSYDHKITPRHSIIRASAARSGIVSLCMTKKEVQNTSKLSRSDAANSTVKVTSAGPLPQRVRVSTSKCSRFIEVSVEDTEGLLGFSGFLLGGEGHSVRTRGGVREVRYARDGTDGVMQVYARTRELVFVRIKYSGRGTCTARGEV